jgi:hypothetical protein
MVFFRVFSYLLAYHVHYFKQAAKQSTQARENEMKRIQINDLEASEKIGQKEMKKIVGGSEPTKLDANEAAIFALKLWKRSLSNGEFINGVRDGGRGPAPGGGHPI